MKKERKKNINLFKTIIAHFDHHNLCLAIVCLVYLLFKTRDILSCDCASHLYMLMRL